MSQENGTNSITPNQAAVRMFASFLITLLLSGILIFGGAGRLNWFLGWVFVAAWIIPKLVFLILLRLHDPSLLVERVTRHKNTQHYDRILIPIYFVFAFGTFIVAGLDGGRFRWSGDVPLAFVIAAYVIYLLGNSLAGWAINSNPFFSAESRIQTDRAQKVASTGPYRFVRHPAYSAAFLLWITTGLMLESWWALIPGFLAGLIMVIRTVYEDRMLIVELPGYAGYAQQVRYRLIPGVW
ncbi:MAG: isoprenylcysteine carboxylmethyltransferase family protein [Anaerolineales bacterium]|nr:isoprenylcysteine carboxylmethyltransferase family protein [Anaerolineales bacterium]